MTHQHGLLSGKVSLITGASSGIGAATAKLFAREGAAVVLAARRVDRLHALVSEIRRTGAEAAYIAMDVSQEEDVRRAVEFTVEKYGRLDLAFNNAGVGCDHESMHLMQQETYDDVMGTNVRGVWHCLQHEISAMLHNGVGGSIVNNSSVAGLQAIPAGAPYIASKHAVIGLTKAAAAEYAPQGIRVNSVAPGTTRTEIIAGWFDRNPGLEEQLHRATPQARTAEPEEIAQAVAWLCSDRSSFVTGAVLPVDGGYTLM
ncbi:SDR family NAD(P)-dependent oxidoreductase [Streptomyces gilvosporeus]|uniref:Short-chain dehydrogenase n=1 Tax=Streptomyces gilvosporeus TaxID=553510 RepID=A0A1V0U1R9_9ACTN|nr:glucose 1-dehydrogenase [Streptomyces gilvosporeus]ARF59126.1 short-chain dehydrogenase [Streptomyces gilvosporeus]